MALALAACFVAFINSSNALHNSFCAPSQAYVFASASQASHGIVTPPNGQKLSQWAYSLPYCGVSVIGMPQCPQKTMPGL
jgi:hypothetical protein